MIRGTTVADRRRTGDRMSPMSGKMGAPWLAEPAASTACIPFDFSLKSLFRARSAANSRLSSLREASRNVIHSSNHAHRIGMIDE